MSYAAPEGDFTWAEVGERIRNLRRNAGLTQVELAERAGLTQGGVFAIESAATNPQLTTLQSIARAFGITVRELITGVKPKPDSPDDRARRLLDEVLASGDPLATEVAVAGLGSALKVVRYHAASKDRSVYDSNWWIAEVDRFIRPSDDVVSDMPTKNSKRKKTTK